MAHDGQLLMTPVLEAATLRVPASYSHRSFLKLESGGEKVLVARGRSLEVKLNLPMPAAGSAFVMDILSSAGPQPSLDLALAAPAERTSMIINGTDGKITLNMAESTRGAVGSRAPIIAPLFVDPGQPLLISTFVDHSIIEVFVNQRVALTARAYPTLDASDAVVVWCVGAGSITLESLDIWRLDLETNTQAN